MKRLGLSMLLALAAAGAADAMPVSTFLAKADALQKRGALAMFSGDLGVLKNEIANAGKAARAEQASAYKAGHRAPFCLPEKAEINSGELMSFFRSLPPAERQRTEVRPAVRAFIARKYPCRT